MQFSSTHKLLFLLNLLSSNEYTKNQIMEKFEQNGMSITKSLITNYINSLIDNGLKINIKINSKREKVYSLEEKKVPLIFSENELKLISSLKKILISQKNPTRIRRTMRLFYKLACLTDKNNTYPELYLSTVRANCCQSRRADTFRH